MRGLAEAGLADTLGGAPTALARPLTAMSAPLGAALAAMLQHPLSAATHAALADSLLVRDVTPRAGLELRIAVTLDPGRQRDRYRLALVMVELGGSDEALVELRQIADDPFAGRLASEARETIGQLTRDGTRAR
jgi:hypothetical protein